MFKVNDTVVYGAQGVCKITEIRQKEIKNGKRDYYVLSPLYTNNSTVFVPTDSIELISKMKKTMSPEELREFIASFPAEKCKWIADDLLRRKTYRQILNDGDRHAIAGLIKALRCEQRKRKRENRKLCVNDELILNRAQTLLCDEFAFVLNTEPERVLSLIKEKIDTDDI